MPAKKHSPTSWTCSLTLTSLCRIGGKCSLTLTSLLSNRWSFLLGFRSVTASSRCCICHIHFTFCKYHQKIRFWFRCRKHSAMVLAWMNRERHGEKVCAVAGKYIGWKNSCYKTVICWKERNKAMFLLRCATAQMRSTRDHLRSEIPFSRTCNIPNIGKARNQ